MSSPALGLLLVGLMVGLACQRVDEIPAAEPGGEGDGWQVVRTVPNPFGGEEKLVLVGLEHERDREHYSKIGESICAKMSSCMVKFWTDTETVPNSSAMNVLQMRGMTARYEASPSYAAPSLKLACWLYATKEESDKDGGCFVLPGAQVPWESAN